VYRINIAPGLFHDRGPGFSVSIYEDEVGIRENLPIALDWIAKNAGSAGGPDQIVSEGTVIMQMH